MTNFFKVLISLIVVAVFTAGGGWLAEGENFLSVVRGEDQSEVTTGEVIELNIQKARERVEEKSREARRSQLGIERSEVNVDMAESSIADLEEDIRDQEDDLSDLKDDIDSLDSDINELISERRRLRQEIKDLEQEMQKSEEAGEYDDYDEGEEDEDTEGAEEENGEEEENGTDEYQEEITQLRGQIAEINQQIFLLEVQRAERQHAEIDQQIDRLEAQREDLEDRRDDMEEGIDEMYEGKEEAEQRKREAWQAKVLAEMEWENSKEILKFSVEGSYVALMSLEEQIAALEENLGTLERMISREKKMYEVGQSTSLQVDMIRQEKRELENTLQVMRENKENMQKDLLDTLDYPLEAELKLEDIDFDQEDMRSFRDSYEVQKAVDSALEDGEEMEIMRKRLEYAEENEEWNRDHHGSGSEEHRMSEIELEEAKIDKEETKNQLQKSIYENYNSFQETARELDHLEEKSSLQGEVFRGEELKLELGMIAKNDILDASAELEEIRRNLRRAEYDTYLAKRQLVLLEQGYLVGSQSDM